MLLTSYLCKQYNTSEVHSDRIFIMRFATTATRALLLVTAVGRLAAANPAPPTTASQSPSSQPSSQDPSEESIHQGNVGIGRAAASSQLRSSPDPDIPLSSSDKASSVGSGEGGRRNAANANTNKHGLRRAEANGDGAIPSDSDQRILQTNDYYFTKFGDGACQDSIGNIHDFFVSSLSSAAECANHCTSCPGQGQGSLVLLGFSYTPGSCYCHVDQDAALTHPSCGGISCPSANSFACNFSGTGEIASTSSDPGFECMKVADPPEPSSQPSSDPSSQPSSDPSEEPSSDPSEQPSSDPSESEQPSSDPSEQPSSDPSEQPSSDPSEQPSSDPSEQPSSDPSSQPSSEPSSEPSSTPSCTPSASPTEAPSRSDKDVYLFYPEWTEDGCR